MSVIPYMYTTLYRRARAHSKCYARTRFATVPFTNILLYVYE